MRRDTYDEGMSLPFHGRAHGSSIELEAPLPQLEGFYGLGQNSKRSAASGSCVANLSQRCSAHSKTSSANAKPCAAHSKSRDLDPDLDREPDLGLPTRISDSGHRISDSVVP
jgi:hypothetical protein